jgi:predicted RNase H-like HicB family nuclease
MKKIFLPIIIGKEGKWYVASCPILDIATQGKTEKEARENIEELVIEYLKDPDTPKPNLETFTFPSLSYIEVSIK